MTKILTTLFIFIVFSYSRDYSEFHFIEGKALQKVKNFIYWECKNYKSKLIVWENIAPIISVESSFSTNAISKDKCRGLMGISEILITEYNRRGRKRIKNFQSGINTKTVFKIRYNIRIGIWYFNQCLKRSRGNLIRAYTLYFWGINSKRIDSVYSRKVIARKKKFIK